MSLTASSRLLTVAKNSLTTAIAIPAPIDTKFASSALVVTVTALPSDGTVLLADGITPVTLGETLTVAQLTGLKFRPTLDSFGTSSTFAFTVSDPASNTASATATLVIGPSNTPLVTTPAGLTENSTSLTVPENSAATVIAIPPPSDANFPDLAAPTATPTSTDPAVPAGSAASSAAATPTATPAATASIGTNVGSTPSGNPPPSSPT